MYVCTFPTIIASFIFPHRQGSVIADFTVVVRELNPAELAEINEKLPSAMSSIAPVIGQVRAAYKSKFDTIMVVFFFS